MQAQVSSTWRVVGRSSARWRLGCASGARQALRQERDRLGDRLQPQTLARSRPLFSTMVACMSNNAAERAVNRVTTSA